MNRNVIIALVVGVLVLGAGVYAFIGMNDDNASNEASSDNTTSQSTTENLVSADNPLGLQTDALKPPYRATVQTEDNEGRVSTAVVEIDADSDVSSKVTDDGQTIEVRIIDGATFSSDAEGKWIKLPAGDTQEASGLELGFTDEDLEDIKNADIVEKGTGPCAAGTCRIYEFTDSDGSTGTVKIDTNSNRVSELEATTTEGEIMKITFEYDVDVDVVEPEEFTEYEIPDLDTSNIEALMENVPTGNQ